MSDIVRQETVPAGVPEELRSYTFPVPPPDAPEHRGRRKEFILPKLPEDPAPSGIPEPPTKEEISKEYEFLGEVYSGSDVPKPEDPDEPPLPPTINPQGLNPYGIAFDLINQYNAETDPDIRNDLYERILTEIQKEEPPFESQEEPEESVVELPETISSEGLDPEGLTVFLIDMYNKETNEDERKLLFDEITTQRKREEEEKLSRQTIEQQELPETISSQGLDPEGVTAWLINRYNRESDLELRQILFDEITEEKQQELQRKETEQERELQRKKTEEEQELTQEVKKIISQQPQPESTSGLTDEDKQEIQKLLAPIEEQVNDDLKPFVSQSEDETTNTQAELQRKRDQKKYAMLSQIAYDSYYTSPEEANAKLKDYMPAHSIILEDTTKNSTVIQKINNKGEREITIAYRGTDPTNALDLVADAVIFSGNITEYFNVPVGRFKQAEDTYKRIKAKYPDAKITLTGHSLGAREALLIGEKYNVPTQVFNVGSSPIDFLVPNAEKKDFIKIYNVATDPISISSRYDTSQEVIDVPNRGNPINPLSAHALTNFLPERVISGQATEKPTTKLVKEPTIAQLPTAPVELPKEDLIVNVVNFEDTSYQLGPLIDPEKTDEPKRFVYQRIPSSTTQVVNNKPLSSFKMIEIFQSVDKERNCKIDPITLKKSCPERRKEDIFSLN